MKTRTVNVIETSKGFLWTERGKYYKTLKGLKIAIKREDIAIANTYKIAVTVLNISANNP